MLDQEMLKEFIEEVGEHIRNFEAAGLALEKDPKNHQLINDMFRAAHSIKGAAGYMGFPKITELSHRMENIIDLVRQNPLSVDKNLVDILFKGIDRIKKLTLDLENTGSENADTDHVLKLIDSFIEKATEGQTHAQRLEIDHESGPSSESPASEEADEELREIYAQQAGEYVTQLCQLILDLEADVDPKGTLLQMTSLMVDFIQLTSYMNEKAVSNILERLLERLGDLQTASMQEPEKWAHEIASDLFTLIDALPANTTIDENILHKLKKSGLSHQAPEESPAKPEVPEKIEGLFAFPLDEKDQALLENFDEEIPGVKEKDNVHGSEQATISEEMISKALESGNIEDEIFTEQPSSTIETVSEDIPKEKSLLETLNFREDQHVVIDEEAVIHSIDENFTEDSLESSSNQFKDTTEGTITEESDKELFEIFLEAFRENLKKLNSIKDSLKKGSGSSPGIEKAVKHLDKMVSSANYMDYENVVRILKKWREEISHLSTSGKDIPEEYARYYVEQTEKLFRVIPGLKERYGEMEEIDEEPVDLADVSSASAEVEVKIDNMFDIIESKDRGTEKAEETEELNADNLETLEVEGFPFTETDVGARDSSDTNEDTEISFTDLMSKQTLRVDTQKVDNLLNQVGELVVTRAGFSQATEIFREIIRQFSDENKLSKQDLKILRSISFRLSESSVSLGRVANELQEAVMKIRMLPVHHLFQRFPRLVRSQSEMHGKKVRFDITGRDTELDKRVLEQMADPLVHMLRNAVAHGIESPEERIKTGKPEEGNIRLSAYHEGNHVVIELEDDGQGIDVDKLRTVLIDKNMINAQDIKRLSDTEIINSIFLPGVSTTDMVDESSGRGVGMDIVKENVERLNGSVEVRSKQELGTRFIIKIPLTVAIIQALLVEVSGQIFTVPLTSVLEITRVFNEEIQTIEGFEVIYLRETTIPLLRLENIFSLEKEKREKSRTFVVIVGVGHEEVGLIVDSLLGEQEVVIKPLSESIRENKCFSGATILGDGSISLILDVGELVEIVRKRNAPRHQHLTVAA